MLIVLKKVYIMIIGMIIIWKHVVINLKNLKKNASPIEPQPIGNASTQQDKPKVRYSGPIPSITDGTDRYELRASGDEALKKIENRSSIADGDRKVSNYVIKKRGPKAKSYYSDYLRSTGTGQYINMNDKSDPIGNDYDDLTDMYQRQENINRYNLSDNDPYKMNRVNLTKDNIPERQRRQPNNGKGVGPVNINKQPNQEPIGNTTSTNSKKKFNLKGTAIGGTVGAGIGAGVGYGLSKANVNGKIAFARVKNAIKNAKKRLTVMRQEVASW